MKGKIITIIILFLVVIGLAIWQEIFVSDSLSNMLKMCNELKNSIETNDSLLDADIQDKLNEIDDYWTKKEEILCFVINHNDMKDVGDAITNIKTFTVQNNKNKVSYTLRIFYPVSCC